MPAEDENKFKLSCCGGCLYIYVIYEWLCSFFFTFLTAVCSLTWIYFYNLFLNIFTSSNIQEQLFIVMTIEIYLIVYILKIG